MKQQPKRFPHIIFHNNKQKSTDKNIIYPRVFGKIHVCSSLLQKNCFLFFSVGEGGGAIEDISNLSLQGGVLLLVSSRKSKDVA